MARLNEPPPPAESVEALKRRFVRQNREIARANSTQSLRIRNLEAETARLLSENLSLREQVINLQHELDSRPGKTAWEDMGSIQERLEAKLQELNGLVFDLGKAQKKGVINSSPTRRSSKINSQRSPNQRNWRNTQTILEVTGLDGRLPPIVEDKYFPRRTLDSEDLLALLSDPVNSAESPELGSPPIAHFGDGDPVKITPTQQADQSDGTSEFRLAAGFTNLETRKKRRESFVGREAGVERPIVNLEDSIPRPDTATASQPLKTGSKRKLSARDEESRAPVQPPSKNDGFRFNRRNEPPKEETKDVLITSISVPVNTTGRKTPQDLSTAKASSRDKTRDASTTITSTTSRKALGEKSVNTDPVVSPVKPKSLPLDEKTLDMKKDIPSKKPRDQPRPRDRLAAVKPIRPPSREQAPPPKPSPPESVTVALPATEPVPQSITHPTQTTTPFHPATDVFSPADSQPSVERPECRDTPPPTDAGRPSRRPRASVSYAEPNLRDKMRRPTKELVDAVGADGKVHRAGSVVRDVSKERDKQSGNESGREGKPVVKKEVNDGEDAPNWGSGRDKSREQGSPLGMKTGWVGGALPTTVMAERRRRISGMPVEAGSSADRASGPGSVIAALVAGTHPATHSREEKPDIYDFHGSSDVDKEIKDSSISTSSSASIPKTSSGTRSDKIRVSRRATSVAEGMRALAREEGDLGMGKAAEVETSAGGRSRRETLGTRGGAETDGPERDGGERAKDEGTRAERAVARRRSMMI